jgi:hypothetical protein
MAPASSARNHRCGSGVEGLRFHCSDDYGAPHAAAHDPALSRPQGTERGGAPQYEYFRTETFISRPTAISIVTTDEPP